MRTQGYIDGYMSKTAGPGQWIKNKLNPQGVKSIDYGAAPGATQLQTANAANRRLRATPPTPTAARATPAQSLDDYEAADQMGMSDPGEFNLGGTFAPRAAGDPDIREQDARRNPIQPGTVGSFSSPRSSIRKGYRSAMGTQDPMSQLRELLKGKGSLGAAAGAAASSLPQNSTITPSMRPKAGYK